MAFENLKKAGIKILLTKIKGYLEETYMQIKNAVRSVNGNEPDADGDIKLTSVPYAQNLESESSKIVSDSFSVRTAGGDASISSGNAWLMNIKGNNVHEDYVPESISPVSSNPALSVAVDRDTFVTAMDDSGSLLAVFQTNWSIDLSTYGITVTGTPADGDTITITYVKEERGTITVTDPQSLVATGWNLLNSSEGIARVVKYDFGYRIDGEYDTIKFSSTLDGTQSDVTVIDGSFDIPTSGYIFVTGSDLSETAVYMTWEDWTEGYSGDFEAYTEHVVNLSTVMANKFPYGLLKAGSAVDEIDLNLAQIISRVERLNYTAENLATAKASGREYEYDTDYIYLERASAVVSSVSIDGAFQSDDHGIEFFPDVDVPIGTEILYGVNLRNKLEREVLTLSQQTLTSQQKAQVRSNIGAMASDDIANNLTTTASGKALDARQGKVLSDRISTVEGRAVTQYYLNANATTEIPMESNARYFIIINSTASTVRDALIVACSSAGAVGCARLVNASNVDLDTSVANKLKITNNATNSGRAYVEKFFN